MMMSPGGYLFQQRFHRKTGGSCCHEISTQSMDMEMVSQALHFPKSDDHRTRIKRSYSIDSFLLFFLVPSVAFSWPPEDAQQPKSVMFQQPRREVMALLPEEHSMMNEWHCPRGHLKEVSSATHLDLLRPGEVPGAYSNDLYDLIVWHDKMFPAQQARREQGLGLVLKNERVPFLKMGHRNFRK